MKMIILILSSLAIGGMALKMQQELTNEKAKKISGIIGFAFVFLFFGTLILTVLYDEFGHFKIIKEKVINTYTLNNSDKLVISNEEDGNDDEDSDYLNISEESINKQNIIDFFVSRNLSDYSNRKHGSDFLLKIRDENGAPRKTLKFTEDILKYKETLPEDVYNEFLEKNNLFLEDIKTKKILQAKEIKEIKYTISNELDLIEYYFTILEATY